MAQMVDTTAIFEFMRYAMADHRNLARNMTGSQPTSVANPCNFTGCDDGVITRCICITNFRLLSHIPTLQSHFHDATPAEKSSKPNRIHMYASLSLSKKKKKPD